MSATIIVKNLKPLWLLPWTVLQESRLKICDSEIGN